MRQESANYRSLTLREEGNRGKMANYDDRSCRCWIGPEIMTMLAYWIVSPVRIKPTAPGTRFFKIAWVSKPSGIGAAASAKASRTSGVLTLRNSRAIYISRISKFKRTAWRTCKTVGTSSTNEISTVSIAGQNGKPRSAITSMLVCRTRGKQRIDLRIENATDDHAKPPFIDVSWPAAGKHGCRRAQIGSPDDDEEHPGSSTVTVPYPGTHPLAIPSEKLIMEGDGLNLWEPFL